MFALASHNLGKGKTVEKKMFSAVFIESLPQPPSRPFTVSDFHHFANGVPKSNV